MRFDTIIVGAGPGGIFTAFELMKEKNEEYKKARKYFYDVSMTLFEEYQKIIWPEEK